MSDTQIEPRSAIEVLHDAFKKRLQILDTEPIDVMLAALTANLSDDVPLWVQMVAPPSSTKGEMLSSLKGVKHPHVHYLSKMTPQTLLSGWSKLAQEDDPSLLKRLPEHTVMVCKDFGTIMGIRPESRKEILSQLREVYDGEVSASFGTGGDVTWTGKLGMIVGVTTEIDDYAPVEQALGERFLRIRLLPDDRNRVACKALANGSNEQALKQELSAAVKAYLLKPHGSVAAVVMSDDMTDRIAALADLIAVGRTAAHRDRNTREIDILSEPEGPGRLARQFGLMARAVAAVRDQAQVEEADLKTTIRVGFDSLTAKRRHLLDCLARHDKAEPGAWIVTADIARELGLSERAARYNLEEACAVRDGLVEHQAGNGWRLTARARDLLARLHRNTGGIGPEPPAGPGTLT